MNTKANGELTSEEKIARKRLEALGIKPAIRRTTRQKFLFKETQVYATRSTIQRTRKMCIHWGKHKNNGGQHATCGFDKDKHCLPAVCPDFMERI